MKFWAGFFTGVIVSVVVIAGIGIWMGNQMEKMRETQSAPYLGKLEESQQADFRMELYDLKTDSLVDSNRFRNKVVLLNFWEYWCEPCRREMPGLEKLYNTIKDSTVEFAFISSEKPDSVRNSPVVKRFHLPWYYSAKVMPLVFNGDAVPRTYIINKKGEVLVSETGASKWDHPDVVHFIDSLKKL